MKFKTEKYKGFTIHYEIEDSGEFYAYCVGIGGESYIHTFSNAQQIMKERVDEFIDTIPNNYTELATQIHDSLVWDSYESCYVDETILETIIENFIKHRKK